MTCEGQGLILSVCHFLTICVAVVLQAMTRNALFSTNLLLHHKSHVHLHCRSAATALFAPSAPLSASAARMRRCYCPNFIAVLQHKILILCCASLMAQLHDDVWHATHVMKICGMQRMCFTSPVACENFRVVMCGF